jgi:hypothetical protein
VEDELELQPWCAIYVVMIFTMFAGQATGRNGKSQLNG